MESSKLVGIITQFFILLFIYAGLERLTEMGALKQELEEVPYLGSMAGLVTWAVPLTEFLTVALLLVPKWRKKGLYFSLSLMSLFTVYLLSMMGVGTFITCNCGGILEQLSTFQLLFFNIACVILAVIGIRTGVVCGPERSVRFCWGGTTVVLVLLCAVGLIVVIAATSRQITKTGFEGRVIPSIDWLLKDSSTHLTSNNIPYGKPFIVMAFSPYCPHCQAEIRDIITNIESFKKTPIYLITFFPISDLRQFFTQFQLSRYPNITVAEDSKNEFLSFFNYHIIPFTAIYDAQKRLARGIQGRAEIDQVKKFIND